MKVFVSWSKPTSHQMALAFRDWLPCVLQQVEPWVSSEDIGKGRRWSVEIAENLAMTSQGIICVTAANMSEAWLNFEAGALAKSLPVAQVRPVLLGLEPSDVKGPLSDFQATPALDETEMYKLVESLNVFCTPPLPADRLRTTFDKFWGDFLRRLEDIDTSSDPVAGSNAPARSTDDLLAEVLERVRTIERTLDEPADSLAAARRAAANRRLHRKGVLPAHVQELAVGVLRRRGLPTEEWPIMSWDEGESTLVLDWLKWPAADESDSGPSLGREIEKTAINNGMDVRVVSKVMLF